VVVPDCQSEPGRRSALSPWPDARGEEAVALCETLGPAMVAARAAREREAAGAGPPRADWEARARAAEDELARVRASHGWRWLGRIYRVLHTIKRRPAPGKAP
jgi:hypothetical protein